MTFRKNILPAGIRLRRLLYPAAVGLIVLFILFLFIPRGSWLVLTERKSGKILFAESVRTGDEFAVSYLHSVNKSEITDVFRIRPDGGIGLAKTVYYSFGAGVATEAEDGSVMRVYDDRLEIEFFDRLIPDYLLFVGIEAEHTFSMGSIRIPLARLTEPQRTVRFTVRRLSRYQYLRSYLTWKTENRKNITTTI